VLEDAAEEEFLDERGARMSSGIRAQRAASGIFR